MNLPRFMQVFRTRWLVVTAIAVVGAGAGLLAATIRNAGLEPLFEGNAPVSVLRIDEENDGRYATRLNTALTQAKEAVRSELEDESLAVSSDSDAGTIQFTATESDPDEALAAATALRAKYLNSGPKDTAEEQLSPILDSLATDIALVQADLAELSQVSTDEVAEIQRKALTSELESATQNLVTAEARLLNPSLTDQGRSELKAQQSAAEATIAAISPLLENLPASRQTVADTRTRLDTMVLQRRLRDLESQYISTAMRQKLGGTDGLVGVPSVVDRSDNRVSPLLAALVGLVVGAFLGGAAVLTSDRLRDPVRSVDDVPGLTAIRISRRPRRLAGTAGWYETASGHARRIDIQALRARIDRLAGRGKIVLLAGVNAPPRDVFDVALDLASAVAVTGRSVLLIDTRVTEPSASPWDEAGPSLTEILSSQDRSVPDRSAIKRMLWDRPHMTSNLMVVPAGSVTEDPVDVLAGLAFSAVVEEARDLVDLVMLATGDVADPVSEAVAGRARSAVIAAQKDRTRKKDLLAGAASLEQLGVAVAAVALVVGSSSGNWSLKGSKSIPAGTRIQPDASARHLGGP